MTAAAPPGSGNDAGQAPAKRCRCTGAESPECHDNTCAMAGHEGGYCIQCEDEDDPERAYEDDDE
jgi:hypothetical protein